MSGRLLEPQRGGGESDAPAPALEARAGGGGRPPVQPPRAWRPHLPTMAETEMEAEAERATNVELRQQAGGAATSAALAANEHQEHADLLAAFSACDLDSNGTIGAAELHAILLAIGAEVSLEGAGQIIAGAKRQAAQAPAGAAGESDAALGRQWSTLSWTEALTTAEGVKGTVKEVASAVTEEVKAVGEAAEEAAERAGLLGGGAAAPSATSRAAAAAGLSFAEFEQLMRSPLLEPLFTSASADAAAPPSSDVAPEEIADRALLHEYFLSEHAPRLALAGLLGKLKDATAAQLVQAGLPVLHSRTLLKAAALAPAARAKARIGTIRNLRRAYEMADCDGDNQLRGQELKTVVLSLHPRAVSDDDIAHLWATLNPHGKPYLSWADFLCGMGMVRRDERAAALMDLSRPNEFELISLLIDVQLSEEEAAVLLEGMSLFNRVGIHALQSMQSAQMDPAELQEVLTRAAEGRLRVLAPERAARVREHQRRIGVIAFVVAVLTNLVPGLCTLRSHDIAAVWVAFFSRWQ